MAAPAPALALKTEEDSHTGLGSLDSGQASEVNRGEMNLGEVYEFARQHLPRLNMDWAPMTAPQLEQCIAHKKNSTTGGLDGVSGLEGHAITGPWQFC